MNERDKKRVDQYNDDLVAFAQRLVRIRSYSDAEGELADAIVDEMKALGYDEVFVDVVGNVVGRMGNRGKCILFDSHMDTVEVQDAKEWKVPPFSGEIIDGRLWGRGSVDMKSALVASVYAGAAAKGLGLTENKTVYVTCSVCEEFCDGENIKHLFKNHNLKPDHVVICEPSDNIITLGHKGKAQIRIKTKGVSAHGSAPEKGINAVYEMAEIINRVECLNKMLFSAGEPHGTVVLSDISCVSASLNAVPSECAIYLDRRMVLGETEEDIKREMDGLVEGKDAVWEIGTLHRKSYTGAALCYEPMHRAWKIDEDHPLTKACNTAYENVFGAAPTSYDFWDFGTNAVTPVSLGIPTIGFGPGEYKLVHMRDENCAVDKIKEACLFYTAVIEAI
ncbi:MAG: YgeY family selenium metabolism-linked hydrolase [Eubacterium sp.]